MFLQILLFSIFFSEYVHAISEKGGMPQLNPDSFASQIFWLTILFSILFLVNHYIFLPRLEKIRKKRDERINGNLIEAQKINDSVNILIEKMRKDFEDAKNNQNSTLKKTLEQNKSYLDEKIKNLNEEFEQKKTKLTNSVESERAKILKDLPSICVKLSDNLYEKIMDEKIKGDISEFKKLVSEK
tara:strand:+ start:102 stop:656 length:555 start_codon:yes stop_codon:yes gene_type:complete